MHFCNNMLQCKICRKKLEEVRSQRTIQQNRALHLYFTSLAKELNGAGWDMKKALPDVDIPWNGKTIKDYLWRPIQKAQLQKQSTTELTTKDIDVIYETLNRFTSEKFSVHVPFPSEEEIRLSLLEEE